MLSIETQKQIARLLKVDEAGFLAALKDEKEVDVKIPELSIFTKEELASRDQNQKKLGYDDGKEAGLDLFIKDQKKKHGLEFDGKDPEAFVTSFQAKVLSDAKVEPNKQLQEKDAVIAKLQGNVSEYETKLFNMTQQMKASSLRSKLIKVVPAGLPFEPEEVIASMELRGYSFDEDEAGTVHPKLNGQVLRDEKTQNVLPHKAVIDAYITERKWASADEPEKAGRGGGSTRKTAGIGKASEAAAEWEKQGKSLNGSEYQAYVQEIAKNNPNFDWDS